MPIAKRGFLFHAITRITAAGLLAFAAMGASQAAPVYSVLDLGALQLPFSSFNGSTANGINSSGQIVGEVTDQAGNASQGTLAYVQRAALFGGNSPGITLLGGLGSVMGIGSAHAINDLGQIVGQAQTGFGTGYHAITHGIGGAWSSDLGTLGGTMSSADAINKRGQIVGYSYTRNDASYHATLFNTGAGNTDLGTLGGNYSGATGINDFGLIVGYATTVGDIATHAMQIDFGRGIKIDLGTLGGNYSVATAVNNLGLTVGYSSLSGERVRHAALFGGLFSGPIDIDTLDSVSSYATAINDNNWVVGNLTNLAGQEDAFLWRNNAMSTLDSLVDQSSGWDIRSAKGINASGQIAATGCNVNIGCHALLLSLIPTATNDAPEPGSLLLFGAALAGLAASRRRRN